MFKPKRKALTFGSRRLKIKNLLRLLGHEGDFCIIILSS